MSDTERQQLEASLRTSDGFVLRGSQSLLASNQGQTPAQIAKAVGRTPQTVGNVIRAFHDAGLVCLSLKSSRLQSLRTIFDDAAIQGLREMLHQSPRNFDQPTSL